MSPKQLLEVLLNHYIENNDLENIYDNWRFVMTIDEALKFVDELKD